MELTANNNNNKYNHETTLKQALSESFLVRLAHPREAHKNEKKILFKDEHENFPHDNFITFTLYVQKLAKKNFLEA